MQVNRADWQELLQQGRLVELEQVLLREAQQPEITTQALLQVAGLLRDSNRFGSAIAVMKKVLERQPGDAIQHFRLARLYQGTGQHEPALQAYRRALQLNPGLGGAWLGLSTLQRFESEHNGDWQNLLAAQAGAEDPESAMCLAFARGKGHDDLGKYQDAWASYVEGNRLRRRRQPWDVPAWQDLVNRALTGPLEPKLNPRPGRKPVFIVGMLRSGTTLLEQLLGQHPQVTPRGELNLLAHAWKLWRSGQADTAMAAELANRVWQHMRQGDAEDRIYIDKNPLNFRFLPLLAAAMPEARILHLRRDGRDSCLSCFMQLFQHPDSAFTSELNDLSQYYHDYLQLMRHFEQAMPGQIMSLAYEDLASDSEATLDAVWEFLGVPAPGTMESENPGSREQRPIRTASAWQARQAVHTRSVGRWQNYRDFAPGFFDRIAGLDRQPAA
jgi:tetratricopeptide (TPR) repeat protein